MELSERLQYVQQSALIQFPSIYSALNLPNLCLLLVHTQVDCVAALSYERKNELYFPFMSGLCQLRPPNAALYSTVCTQS